MLLGVRVGEIIITRQSQSPAMAQERSDSHPTASDTPHDCAVLREQVMETWSHTGDALADLDEHFAGGFVVGGVHVQDHQGRSLLAPLRVHLQTLGSLALKLVDHSQLYACDIRDVKTALPLGGLTSVAERIRSELHALAPERLPPEHSWLRENTLSRYKEAVGRMTDLIGRLPPRIEGSSSTAHVLPRATQPTIALSPESATPFHAPSTSSAAEVVPSSCVEATKAQNQNCTAHQVITPGEPAFASPCKSQDVLVLNDLLSYLEQELIRLSEANETIPTRVLEHQLAELAGHIFHTRTQMREKASQIADSTTRIQSSVS